jgi:hypothetical protein
MSGLLPITSICQFSYAQMTLTRLYPLKDIGYQPTHNGSLSSDTYNPGKTPMDVIHALVIIKSHMVDEAN